MDSEHRLWVYRRGHVPESTTPKKAANRPDFYGLVNATLEPQAAERALAEAECKIAPTVKKIANIAFQPSLDQKCDLLMFAALSFVRVPAYLDYVTTNLGKWAKDTVISSANDREKFKASWERFRQSHGSNEDPEAIRNQILEGNYNIKPRNRDLTITLMFTSMQRIAEILSDGFECEIWHAPPDKVFVTSDNPVVTLRPAKGRSATAGVGFGHADTEIVMPLNKRVCLHASRAVKWGRRTISARHCDQINCLVMAAASEVSFGSIGTRRQGRLFDQFGCRLEYGKNSFLPKKH